MPTSALVQKRTQMMTLSSLSALSRALLSFQTIARHLLGRKSALNPGMLSFFERCQMPQQAIRKRPGPASKERRKLGWYCHDTTRRVLNEWQGALQLHSELVVSMSDTLETLIRAWGVIGLTVDDTGIKCSRCGAEAPTARAPSELSKSLADFVAKHKGCRRNPAK